MKQYTLFFTILFALFASSHFFAFAGGSYEQVQINSIEVLSNTDYILIVTPLEESAFSYMKDCPIFEVHGGYRRPKGSLFFEPHPVNISSHKAAIKLLQNRKLFNKPVKFGWIGEGFGRTTEDNPCIVKSNALDLIDDVIFSFYKWP